MLACRKCAINNCSMRGDAFCMKVHKMIIPLCDAVYTVEI